MDELQQKVDRVSKEIIGKSVKEAEQICRANGLLYRWVIHRGKGHLITADCKANRIGFVTDANAIVIETRNG